MHITRGEGSALTPSQPAWTTVSVVVPSLDPAHAIGECLASLAAQTLSRDRFEVVVVHSGGQEAVAMALRAARAHHPGLDVRVLESRECDSCRALNLGLSAARGAYVTVVDGEDRVSETYLQALLDHARPGVVVVAPVLEPAGHRSDRRRSAEGSGVVSGASGSTPAFPLSAAFGRPHATLVPTDLARSARYDARWRGGAAHAYWLALLARSTLRPHALPVGGNATYLRRTSVVEGSHDAVYEAGVTRSLQALEALEAVSREDPTVQEVALALRQDEARRINQHLRAHPTDHARVALEAEEMGLRDAPWSHINEGLARDLALCYCFPPYLDTSGMVAAKRIRDRGAITDVVSQDLSAVRGLDPGSLRVPGEFLGRHQVVGGRPSFNGWEHVPRFAEAAVATVEEWEAEQGPYRTVYSRAMAVASHFAAALVKVRHPHVRWVAEFSDPMRLNILGGDRPDEVVWDWLAEELAGAMRVAGYEPVLHPGSPLRLFEWVERLVFALADEIVFTNDHQRQLMLDHCEDAALVERALAISEVHAHPVLPQPFYELDPVALDLRPDRVHLAYFGVFYRTRDLGDLVEALLLLRQHEREQVHLHVYTADPVPLSLRLTRAGLAGTVTVHRYRPLLEFLNLTTQFDVLVLDDAHTAEHHETNPYLPSKLADYRGSGTSIWAINEKGSVMSGMQFDFSSALGDVDGAVLVLRSLIKARVRA